MLKNDLLPFDQLPMAERLPFEPLPRAGLVCDVLASLKYWAIAALASVFAAHYWFDNNAFIAQTWLWLAPLILAQILWPVLAWRYQGMVLREHDLLLQEGVIFRSLTAQSLARVQHVKLHQGPLQRLFGLATLVLYTAGKHGADFKLRHLTYARAEQLRQYILLDPAAAKSATCVAVRAAAGAATGAIAVAPAAAAPVPAVAGEPAKPDTGGAGV